MSNPLEFLPGFEGMKTLSNDNKLWEYIQAQDPGFFQDMASNSSPEVLEILGHNIRNILGGLPPEHFGVQVMTSRESLAKMLSSAMMGGYLLRSIEQRLQLEQQLSQVFERDPELSESQDGSAEMGSHFSHPEL
jgi:hypothetical protein